MNNQKEKIFKESAFEKNQREKSHERENGLIKISYASEDLTEEKQEPDRLTVDDIKFIQKDGKKFSFRSGSGLPGDVKLVEVQGLWLGRDRNGRQYAKTVEYFKKEKTLIFASLVIGIDNDTGELGLDNFLELDGAMFSLLHDIGHSIQGEERYKRYEELSQMAIDNKLTEEDIEDYVNIVIGAERDAHEFAIKKLRQLRKDEGIDLEAGLKTLGDIGRLVRSALNVYRKPIQKFSEDKK